MTAPVSHWFAALGGAAMPAPRAPLAGGRTADVCVVGGGYTGLWTAYELRRARPDLDVVVLERDVCGFGASGRNGGWVQGEIAGDPATWIARGGPDGARRMHEAIRATVGEVAAVTEREGIACDLHAGGTLTVARSALELGRLRAHADAARDAGTWAEDQALLSPAELAQRIRVPGAHGASWDPSCARVDPARLARGLADAAERAGATIHEGTAVTAIVPARGGEPALARTARGDVRARWVVRATEGYTPGLAGEGRTLAPITSSMIVTAPLGPERWARIGWSGAETILDAGPLYHYLQRTADGRIAIGGRGVPYRYGSRTDREGPVPASTVDRLREGLVRLFGPVLAGVAIDGAWHGVLGVPRDWTPFVVADPGTGIAAAGGYVGEGVAAANLAGRTLRDLLLGEESDLTGLPWVLPAGDGPPAWEPEPLRFAGIRGVYGLLGLGEAIERRTGRASRVTALAGRISGH